MTRTLLIYLLSIIALSALFSGCNDAASRMSPGDILYRGKCSSCHMLIAPERLNKEEWTMYIDRYGKKMTLDQKQRLLDYLTGAEQQSSEGLPLGGKSPGPIAEEDNR